MKKSEAALLLAHAAAFDNRTVGEVDATAWAAALSDVPLDDDATAAVARYYGTPPERPGERLWLQPHHVKSGRLAIRQARLGTTLPGYLPPAELETGAEFITRRQQQIDDVAAGRTPARPIALAGGMAPAVAARLQAIGFAGLDGDRGLAPVGRTVTDEPADGQPALDKARRPGPLGVECPQCHAPIGRPCKTYRGHATRTIHGPRRRAAVGEPADVLTVAEMERRRAYYSERLQAQAAAQEQIGEPVEQPVEAAS